MESASPAPFVACGCRSADCSKELTPKGRHRKRKRSKTKPPVFGQLMPTDQWQVSLKWKNVSIGVYAAITALAGPFAILAAMSIIQKAFTTDAEIPAGSSLMSATTIVGLTGYWMWIACGSRMGRIAKSAVFVCVAIGIFAQLPFVLGLFTVPLVAALAIAGVAFGIFTLVEIALSMRVRSKIDS